jgi:glutamate-1-semialdehyde 2,1-aminomutase
LSKRPEMHAPTGWPSYFDRASGCHIWDLDGTRYTDVGWMGVGTNILGYANPKVDEAVKKTIEKGNLSTLNAPEEVHLAELLCDIHPWADMARFTRSGGEAGAVAVRIARAAAGKDHIAFCGYHGWHDWYLSANLGDSEALDGHLLPGLSPQGVPRDLKGSASPFEFNNLENLRQVVKEHSSGVIYMEVERSQPPTMEFLQGARDLATEVGAVLVFDECTSGFRSVLGGQHLKYGVNPDIVVLGKTLGNGYAINAVVGIRSVMEHAQDTFISSTFWTERIGPTAALATLAEMRAVNAPYEIDQKGRKLQENLVSLGLEVGLDLEVTGMPALTFFSIEGSSPQQLRTLVTQELLSNHLLGGTSVYVSMAHSDDVLADYLDKLKSVLTTYRDRIAAGTLDSVLTDGLIQQGFRRLA